MRKKFSTKWKGSSQPRKQRKYLANSPIHIKRNSLSVNLSKDLRKKYGTRNLVVRKGDTVQIMRGKNKKAKGKVIEVQIKKLRVYVEGIQAKKQDGSKVNIPLRTSNLQIVELNLDDKKRIKNVKTEGKNMESKENKKTENKK